MNEIIIILSALTAGSFANTIISYYSGNSKFDLLRSICLCGDKFLFFKDLVPLLSYIIYLRKCRLCSKIIPLRYPLVEFLTLLLGISCYLYFPYPSSLIYFLLFYILLIIGIIDFLCFIIPNIFLIALLLLTFVRYLIDPSSFSLLNAATGGAIVILLLVINLLSSRLMQKQAIGYGDVKLIFVLALTFNFLIVLIGLWLSSVFALVGFVILKKFSDRFKYEKRVPFGFFLSISFILISFYENTILNFYYSLVGVGV